MEQNFEEKNTNKELWSFRFRLLRVSVPADLINLLIAALNA